MMGIFDKFDAALDKEKKSPKQGPLTKFDSEMEELVEPASPELRRIFDQAEQINGRHRK